MEDFDAQFNAIMKENKMDDWEPLSLDELLIVVAAVTTASAQLSNMLVDHFDAEDEGDLKIPAETARLMRVMYRAIDGLLDAVIGDVLDESEDEELEEDDDEDGTD